MGARVKTLGRALEEMKARAERAEAALKQRESTLEETQAELADARLHAAGEKELLAE